MLAYHDTEPGGRPDAIVLLHGLLVNGGLWDGVVARIDRRCVVPELPLGCHSTALPDGADRTPTGVAEMVAELLEELDLRDVVLVGNDTGGAIAQIVAANHPERIGKLVLTPCDTHEVFLPKIFRPLQWAAHVPGGLFAAVLPLRYVAGLRRLPFAFGRLIKRPVHRELENRWIAAFLADRGVRKDVEAFTASIHPRYTLEAAEKLRGFDKPVLLAWAPEDKSFTLANAERLAADLPDARIERVEDSYTFVSLDQPERTAELITAFAGR